MASSTHPGHLPALSGPHQWDEIGRLHLRLAAAAEDLVGELVRARERRLRMIRVQFSDSTSR